MDTRLKRSIDRYINNANSFIKNTPFFLFDLKILEENYRTIKRAFIDGSGTILYAVKANNESHVIRTLKKLGSGFEIASKGELEVLMSHSIPPKNIFFSSPVKIPEHIAAAYKYSVSHFAFDSSSELEKIAQHAPHTSVYLRIHTSNAGSVWKLDHKFGASKKNWIALFRKAVELKLKPEGITFHVGWNNHNTGTWVHTLTTVAKLIGSLQKIGINIQFVNLGGGFPAHSVDQFECLKQIASKINPILNKLVAKHNIKVYAEPGTFLVANCGALITRVYAKIKRGGTYWLYVDSPMTNGFYWILADLSYEIHTMQTRQNKSNIVYSITGPTCDSYDTFRKKIKLPRNIAVGDLLTITPAGAYVTSAKEYNSFPYPKTQFICK
jgi:ornithine decarboxylase